MATTLASVGVMLHSNFCLIASFKPPLRERHWLIRFMALKSLWIPFHLTEEGLAYRDRYFRAASIAWLASLGSLLSMIASTAY
jgi:hypothetical protein